MASLSFEQSGQPAEVTLAAAQQLALQCGFERPGAGPGKPPAARADMAAFFKHYGVNSLSAFARKWATTRLYPPGQGCAEPPAESAAAVGSDESDATPITVPVPDVSQYDALSAGLDKLKWRMIPRPGGASMKPADYYTLKGYTQQAELGDNEVDKPMWAEHGGLDFDGREKWEAWLKCKGMSAEDARKAFCVAYARALSRESQNFRRH